MQKLFFDCYAMDKTCYERYGLSEDILMENAAAGISDHIKEHFPKNSKVAIIAGPGNNGADGITVARQLARSYEVALVLPLGVKSDMAQLQLHRAQKLGIETVEDYSGADVIVDALFGAGLDRELSPPLQELIEQLNKTAAYRIACDVPTGLSATGALLPLAFEADITFTMGALKEALYSDNAVGCAGEIRCVDLGVSREAYEGQSACRLLEKSDFKPPLRGKANTHKGRYGHLNVLCGEKEGAALICAQAGLRYGAGLVSLVTREKLQQIPPSLMHSHDVAPNCSALCVGMGLGNYFLDEFLQHSIVENNFPLVLDADGLENETLLQTLKQQRQVVITPHPKEFSRLLKRYGIEKSVEQIQNDRFGAAREFGKLFPGVTLVLKGACSVIARGQELYVNPFCASSLSQGGSGDMLSGLIGALLAQGYDAKEAALQGSLALSFAARSYGGADFSATPETLIEQLAHLG